MSEQAWRAWAEQMATGLALVDADLRLRWLNPALVECLDLGFRSAVGQPLGLLLDDAGAGMAQAAKVLAEQRSAQWRGVLLAAANGGREISADIALQPFGDGLLLEVHVLAEPPSTGSPLSATLRGFAHEVKNPLAGLRGAAQLLQRRVDNEDLQALAGMIIEEADRLGALANRLLHHDGAAQPGPVNIHRLLERLCDLLLAESAPLQLHHDYDPSVPELRGDADRLQQVLLNLARNALEAGAHALTLRTRVEHGLRVGERMLRMALRVDVIDDGPGVPAALRDTLFQPLVSGRADGSGLGLALSREIAHEHGGELRYTSRPGHTVFSLYLTTSAVGAHPVRDSSSSRDEEHRARPKEVPCGRGALLPEIWIVDDDRGVRFVLAEALRDAGLAVREFDAVAGVRAALREARPALLLTDVRMPGEDGLGLLGDLQAQGIGPVIVMSAYTDVATTAAAYRLGAVDYLAKPFDLDQAVAAVQRALASVAAPTVAAGHMVAPSHALLGESAPMREVFRLIGRVAASDLNVLVIGETGTGKELVARALHEESARRDKPFVALNTAAIPSELLESELFGHEAGAFTGATRRVAGRFEQAEGGTLFLDEIGDMPLALQTRLLRVLAGGEFYRVGGRELIRGNVRIVAATHQDLAARVAAGQFRADLMHRLDVVRIELPPLRTRRSDIPLLARHFLAATAQELKLPPKRFSRAALKLVTQRDYPGNVRELENLCRRLAVIAPGSEILPGDLGGGADTARGGGWTDALREWAVQALADGEADIHARARGALDQTLLHIALQANGGHRQNAAQALGVGRNTLTRKLGASRTRKS